MTVTAATSTASNNEPLSEYIDRIMSGGVLLPESPTNVMEVVGILHSYGIVLDAYSINLIYGANHQFLRLFPFFKYLNGDVTADSLMKHWAHDRINYEYAEYCGRTMMWHGGGGLDEYLDSDEFEQLAKKAITAKAATHPVLWVMNRLFPKYLVEQVRLHCYYSGLGQFWRVMSDIFVELSDLYDQGKITTIAEVTDHIQAGIVAAAGTPITYSVEIGGKTYDILPAEAELAFLFDTAVPYVESVFFRGTPFFGTVSYNAQAEQISPEQADFAYGALYADPLPIGGAGIPPTLLMEDMDRYLPAYLHEFYSRSCRGEDDLHIQVCQTFQKSMFCVTTAAIRGLSPHPVQTTNPDEQAKVRNYLSGWMKRLQSSRLAMVNQPITLASCTLYPPEAD